jgi:hypothetical protein
VLKAPAANSIHSTGNSAVFVAAELINVLVDPEVVVA